MATNLQGELFVKKRIIRRILIPLVADTFGMES
jgi:hypothetical protein